MSRIQIETIQGLIAFIKLEAEKSNTLITGSAEINGYYCNPCGAVRRMWFKSLHAKTEIDSGYIRTHSSKEIEPFLTDFLFTLHCLQCQARYQAFVFDGAQGKEIAIFGKVMGGVTTPNSPLAVSFYLDQAHRSAAVSAHSASVAMYRAALEQLLYQQGFTTGMLNKKIQDLEAAIGTGNASRWALDLDPEFLKVIKDLGNAAIHPNAGDITKQEALDRDLVLQVEQTFAHILDEVYEEPARKAGRLAALQAAKQKTQP